MRRKGQFRGPVLLALIALGGCSTTQVGPASTIRTSVETAPADLQLLCASEAASRFGVPGDKVLPISSGREGNLYLVELRLPSGGASCLIDAAGNIASVTLV